jgi:4-hydroxy-tetrahydrodipicolinate reductase
MTEGPIRVALCGAHGRMGRELGNGLPLYSGIQVVAGCDPSPLQAGAGAPAFPVTNSLEPLIAESRPDVVVDFTVAEAALANAKTALQSRVPIVIGTTGLSDADLAEIDTLASSAGVGALVAPNFAIGAILLAQFARTASKYFDMAEVIEIHHDQKIDAPSGTAMMIARAMRESRDRPFGSDNVHRHTVEGARGASYQDLHVHSLRLPGFVATHEVIFGGPGQSLTIRHDAPGRDSYLPGVAHAVKHIHEYVGLVYGLDRMMDFS